jgi:hypothetical protein
MAKQMPPAPPAEGSPDDMAQDAAGAASADMTPAQFEGSPQDEAEDAMPPSLGGGAAPGRAPPGRHHVVGGHEGGSRGGHRAPHHGGTHPGHDSSGQHRHHGLHPFAHGEMD